MSELNQRSLKELLQKTGRSDEENTLAEAVENAFSKREVTGREGTGPSNEAMELAINYLTLGGMERLDEQMLQELEWLASTKLHKSISMGLPTIIRHFEVHSGLKITEGVATALKKKTIRTKAPTDFSPMFEWQKIAAELGETKRREDQLRAAQEKKKAQPLWKRLNPFRRR